MRTAILVSAMILSDAINPDLNLNDGDVKFYAMILFGCMVMDVFEFFKYLNKK